MGRTHRKDLLRKADAAAHALERSATHLKALYEIYDPDYPDLALHVMILGKSVLELRDNVIRFRKENM